MEHRKSTSKDIKRAAKSAQRIKTSKAIAKNYGLEPLAVFIPIELKHLMVKGGLGYIKPRHEIASININLAISAFLLRLAEQLPIELSTKSQDIENLVHSIADDCIAQGIHVKPSPFKNI